MDGLDRPFALYCERRAIPEKICIYLKNMEVYVHGGAIGAEPGRYRRFRIPALRPPDRTKISIFI
jgi:hypothetical protein